MSQYTHKATGSDAIRLTAKPQSRGLQPPGEFWDLMIIIMNIFILLKLGCSRRIPNLFEFHIPHITGQGGVTSSNWVYKPVLDLRLILASLIPDSLTLNFFSPKNEITKPSSVCHVSFTWPFCQVSVWILRYLFLAH